MSLITNKWCHNSFVLERKNQCLTKFIGLFQIWDELVIESKDGQNIVVKEYFSKMTLDIIGKQVSDTHLILRRLS